MTEEEANRQSKNNLKNGLKLKSRSGKTYTVYQLESIDYIDRDGIEKEFIQFKICDSNKRKIGEVSQYTTQERIDSILERYENPNHFPTFEFIGEVLDASSSGYTNLYIRLSEPLATWYNVLVDDGIDLEIENQKGQILKDPCYHISKMNRYLIINLNRMKRYVWVDNENYDILSTKEYKTVDESKLFIKKNDIVKVKIIPNPTNNEFSFIDGMRKDVKLLRKRSGE